MQRKVAMLAIALGAVAALFLFVVLPYLDSREENFLKNKIAARKALELTEAQRAELKSSADPQSRYPWDYRPAHCFTDSPKRGLECAADTWPDHNNTASRVAILYRSEKFRLLERALGDIMGSNKRFPTGYTAPNAAYWGFRSIMNGGNFDPADRERIGRWKKAVPESFYAVFAEARYHYASAWSVRGGGYANTVSRESWELFNIRLLEAEKILLQAPQALKKTPLWHQLLLAITLDTNKTQSNAEAVFNDAIAAFPDYFPFYEVILTRLTPKWGGSWDIVDAYINHWSKQRAAVDGDTMYARLYVYAIRHESVAPGETRVDWPRFRKSFEDLLARYPDLEWANVYASYACAARDKSAFGEAIRKLPPQMVIRDVWLGGNSYDACVRWAGA